MPYKSNLMVLHIVASIYPLFQEPHPIYVVLLEPEIVLNSFLQQHQSWANCLVFVSF